MTHSRGILFALAAFLGWVLVDTAIKLGGQAAIPPFAIMAILNLSGACGLLAWVGAKRNFSVLRLSHPRAQSIIALLMVLINYANIVALKHLPLTIFYIVVFTMPLAMAIASTLFRHEKPTTTKIICVLVGFAGVLAVLMPRLGSGGEIIGYAAGLASVACFVAYTLIVRTMPQTTTTESMLFWNVFPVGVIGVLFSLNDWPSLTVGTLAIVAGGGLLNIVTNGLYNEAARITTPTNVAQTHYTQIIFGALIGYLLWNEMPTWNLLAGAVLIIGAGLVVARQARRDDKAATL